MGGEGALCLYYIVGTKYVHNAIKTCYFDVMATIFFGPHKEKLSFIKIC